VSTPTPRRQKILFLNHVSSVSGAEASLLDMLAVLDRDRYDCKAIIPAPGPLSERLERAGIRTVFVPMRRFKRTRNPLILLAYLFSLLTGAWRIARFVRREGIALVHANSNNAHLYGGLAARWAGIPCVWHSRDLVDLGRLGKWMSARAVTIIAISKAVKRHLCQYAPETKIVVIHNGLDATAFEKVGDRLAVRREWGISKHEFLIGMAGQLVPWKNHALFIEAASRIAFVIPEARFLIVGACLFDRDTGYETRLRALARKNGLEGRLVFAGYRSDMGAVLATLDLLIHPADKEPLGRVILEAMVLGKPVIAIDASGPAEIIRSGIDGFLVPPGDVEGMAVAAIALWEDRNKAARIGVAARERILRDFGTQDVALKIGSVYEDIFKSRGATRCPKVAYVLAEFPSMSETFILREMMALEQRGVQILPFALRRPVSNVTHPEAKPFLVRVHYRLSLTAWPSMTSVLYVLFKRPFRFLSLLGKALAKGDPDDGSRLRAVYHLLTAAEFARAAGRSGVTQVHAHFAYVPADIGAMMARLLGVRFSLSAHAWDLYTRKKEATRARVRAASFVAVCTREGRDCLKGVCPWLPDDRLVLLRHGVFPDRYARANAMEPVILGVGRLEEKKGFQYLIDACRLLKESGVRFRCVMAGGGTLYQPLLEQIEKSGLTLDVSLAGELTQDKLMDLYGTAMVLVVPSVAAADGDRDGLPNVLLEAMAMQIPVLATASPAITEVITDGVQGLLVPPGNSQRLAEGLKVLLADEGARQRMGGRGRETVCRDFNVNRNVEKLVDLFGGHCAN
jgi:glycosyltransferase involved in cell wall biosynthesis